MILLKILVINAGSSSLKYQFIDMKEKGLSKGEFQSVCKAIGGYNKLIDTDCKDKDLLALITYIAE